MQLHEQAPYLALGTASSQKLPLAYVPSPGFRFLYDQRPAYEIIAELPRHMSLNRDAVRSHQFYSRFGGP